MGTILQPSCLCKTPFKPVSVGRGALSFTTFRVPFLCYRCQQVGVAEVNYRQQPIRLQGYTCSSCQQPVVLLGSLLINLRRDEQEALWEDEDCWHIGKGRFYRLPEGPYPCPQCEHTGLDFAFAGCWD